MPFWTTFLFYFAQMGICFWNVYSWRWGQEPGTAVHRVCQIKCMFLDLVKRENKFLQISHNASFLQTGGTVKSRFGKRNPYSILILPHKFKPNWKTKLNVCFSRPAKRNRTWCARQFAQQDITYFGYGWHPCEEMMNWMLTNVKCSGHWRPWMPDDLFHCSFHCSHCHIQSQRILLFGQ